MGMQDITGRFALPLARPFSDLPPPFGRRRRPFVKSKQPRPGVFNLHGTREAPVSAAVRAADFGSDNKPWVKPRPARRRWQPTLLTLAAGLVLGSVGLAGAHAFHGSRRAPSRNTVYQAAITAASVRNVKAPVMEPVVPDDTPGMAAVATAAAIGEMAAVRDEAALTPGASAAAPSAPTSSSKARRKTVRLETARERLAAAAPASGAAGGAASRAQAVRQTDASPASSGAAHAAVGMTANEFKQWLAATREPSRAAAAAPAPDLRVDLPGHTRLTDAGATTESTSEQ